MRAIVCYSPLAVRRTHSGVAGGYRIRFASRWRRSASAVVTVVAVLRNSYKGHGIVLRD